MDNKVLIKLNVPELSLTFDIFIPVNELIWKINSLIIKSINDMMNLNINIESKCILINKSTSRIYLNNEVIINTDIRNATELILIIY